MIKITNIEQGSIKETQTDAAASKADMETILRYYSESGDANFKILKMPEIKIPNNLSKKHPKKQIDKLKKMRTFVENNNKVGYKKPPKSGQFKPGQSGNPAGRKKKPKAESLYQAFVLFANETQTVQINEKTSKKMNMLEILAGKVFQDALKKDGYSRKFILEYFLKENIKEQSESILQNIVQNTIDEAEQTAMKQTLLKKLDVLLKEQQEYEEMERNSQQEI